LIAYALYFFKKVHFSLNIPGQFGIMITTIENVERKIEQFEVKIQHLITTNKIARKGNFLEHFGL